MLNLCITLHMAISGEVLFVTILFLISYIECSDVNQVFVSSDSIIQIEDYGMCSSLKVDISDIDKTIRNSNSSSYNTWIIIKGFIDDEYVGQCDSASSCNLHLSKFTLGHTFKYSISTNNDAYFDYVLTNEKCGIIDFYIFCVIFIGISCIGISLSTIMLTGIVMLYVIERREREKTVYEKDSNDRDIPVH